MLSWSSEFFLEEAKLEWLNPKIRLIYRQSKVQHRLFSFHCSFVSLCSFGTVFKLHFSNLSLVLRELLLCGTHDPWEKATVTAVPNYLFLELDYPFFVFQDEFFSSQTWWWNAALAVFLYPFPIVSIKVFLSRYSWTISTVSCLMPVCLSTTVHGENPLCNMKWFDKGGCTFLVPIPHSTCAYTQKHTHPSLQPNSLLFGDHASGVHGQARTWTYMTLFCYWEYSE